MEYVRLLGGTAINGHAELAVCKTSAGGCETPCSEPGMDLLDLLDSEDEDFNPRYGGGGMKYKNSSSTLQSPVPTSSSQHDPNSENDQSSNIVGMKKGHQRRLSDPSSTIHDFMRMGILDSSNHKNQPSFSGKYLVALSGSVSLRLLLRGVD